MLTHQRFLVDFYFFIAESTGSGEAVMSKSFNHMLLIKEEMLT